MSFFSVKCSEVLEMYCSMLYCQRLSVTHMSWHGKSSCVCTPLTRTSDIRALHRAKFERFAQPSTQHVLRMPF